MKKTYLSPQSLTIALHTEGSMLKTISIDRPGTGGDPGEDPGDIRSKQNFDFDDDDDNSDNAPFL